MNYTAHTDYESDTAYLSDMPQQSPPALRSNEELNLSVCRRHNPDITSILSLAEYAVVYTFSPVKANWEKLNIEGTLFVCQLTPGSLGEERFTAFLLSRRSLDNFDCLLTSSENVEITDEYVILKQDKPKGSTGSAQLGECVVYGIWIYSEPGTSTADTRTVNAKIISECAARAGLSKIEAKARAQAARQDGFQVAPSEEVQSGIPTGHTTMSRSVSLKDLFKQDDTFPAQHNQDNAKNNGWSAPAHHGQAPQPQVPYHPQVPMQHQPLPMQNLQYMQHTQHTQQSPVQFASPHPQMHSPAMALQQQHFHQQGYQLQQLQQQQFQQQQALLQQQQLHQQYLQQQALQHGAQPRQPQSNPNLVNLFQRALDPRGPGGQ